MTQEIKQKLKQAAETAWEEDTRHNPNPCNPYAYVYGYKAGAQTILENPSEWGLVGAQWEEDAIHNADTGVEIAAERDKYREALEHVLQLLQDRRPNTPGLGAPINIIKEALKQ